MTLLGAVVFGGLLTLAVLWLLVTAPANDAPQASGQAQLQERSNSVSAAAAGAGSSPWALTHSSQK